MPIEKLKALAEKATTVEVYWAEARNLGRFHSDFIGGYMGSDLDIIPEGADIRFQIMDRETYGNTVMGNCCVRAEDVMEPDETVLVIQYHCDGDDDVVPGGFYNGEE